MSASIRHLAFIFCFMGYIITTQAASPSVHNTSIVFPAENEVIWRTLSNAIHLMGVSILAYCLARRTDRFSARGFTSIPIARWLVILIFLDSWLFLFAAGLLISGIGLSLNPRACEAGIFLCIVLYAISKLLIYWFLVEKVHLVHPHPSHSRYKSPAYRVCILFVLGYGIVLLLMITGRIAFIRDGNQIAQGGLYDHGNDGSCVIGLGRAASMSMLIYDLVLNVFFTSMFLYPVYKSAHLSPRLKTIAKRTLAAATVALITSAVNVCVLTALHGQELGWICLASCGADVAVNAVSIYAVTASVDDHEDDPHPEHLSEKGDRPISSGSSQKSFIHKLRKGLRRLQYPKPDLPTVNVATTPSNQGILETGRSVRSSDILSSTRSVHFSPETIRHSRGLTMSDLREISMSPSVVETGASAGATLSILSEVDSGSNREANTSSGGTKLRRTEERGTAWPPLPDPGEQTSVEVRHEGPIGKRSSGRPGIIASTSYKLSRKRSKSVESLHSVCKVVSLSDVPSTLEEARERIYVLSALTDIGGGKRKNQVDQNLLEVSVVTQMDQRIERRRNRGTFDDYHRRRYDRLGNSFSSSGGF